MATPFIFSCVTKMKDRFDYYDINPEFFYLENCEELEVTDKSGKLGQIINDKYLKDSDFVHKDKRKFFLSNLSGNALTFVAEKEVIETGELSGECVVIEAKDEKEFMIKKRFKRGCQFVR